MTLVNDYIESINLYTSGKFDACTMANMDALTIPAVGGVDSTALIVGDFSNGNDGIIMKNGSKVTDLKGRKITLVELSVSHYLLARALDMNGMSEQDVNLINTSDADIAALFTADSDGAAVTWNPPLMQALRAPGSARVFDSSSIPGEIIDLMVVRTDTPETLKKALVGAWYEVMAIMESDGPKKKRLLPLWPRPLEEPLMSSSNSLQLRPCSTKPQMLPPLSRPQSRKRPWNMFVSSLMIRDYTVNLLRHRILWVFPLMTVRCWAIRRISSSVLLQSICSRIRRAETLCSP